MSHQYHTTMTFSLPGLDEHEKSLRIEYSRIKGSARTSYDPGSSDDVQIDRILVLGEGGYVPAAWLEDLLREDEELLGQLRQDWIDDDDRARDRRDEDRAQAVRDEARA